MTVKELVQHSEIQYAMLRMTHQDGSWKWLYDSKGNVIQYSKDELLASSYFSNLKLKNFRIENDGMYDMYIIIYIDGKGVNDVYEGQI